MKSSDESLIDRSYANRTNFCMCNSEKLVNQIFVQWSGVERCEDHNYGKISEKSCLTSQITQIQFFSFKVQRHLNNQEREGYGGW